MNRRTGMRRRLLPAAALLAPMAVVLVLRLMGTGHPSTSMAASSMPVPPEPDPAATPPAPPLASKTEVEAALEWIGQRTATLPARSPMDFEPPVVVERPQAAPAAPIQTEVPVARPKGAMHVSSVMSTDRETLATIDGRLVRVGDAIEPGWTVVDIDAKRLVVVIEGPNSRRLELSRSGVREKE